MPEVQNIGAVDYAMPYANQNINVEEPQITEDIEPVMYNPEVDEQKSSSSSLLPIALTSLTLGALCLWGGHKWGKSAAEDALKELENLKNSEAVKNYENLKKATDEIAELADNNAVKFEWTKPSTWFKNNALAKKIQELLAPFKKEEAKVAETAEKAAKEGAEKAGETAADAADKAGEAA